MTNINLTSMWIQKLEILDIAFQPIINTNTGKTYGVEALLRNYQDIGFESIFSLFDTVFDEKLLYSFDLALREKAFKKFKKIDDYKHIKLFYNLDNRLLLMDNFTIGNTKKILQKLDIKQETICFEISERHKISNTISIEQICSHYKHEDISIAIDDFGTGYSGYKLFYNSTPDIIKIDRFFISNIEKDIKKRTMVSSITKLAKLFGIKVLAEGVETKEEYLTCRDTGCQYIQGYYVQKPSLDVNKIKSHYKHISEIVTYDKRNKNILIQQNLEKIAPIQKNSKMDMVIKYYQIHHNTPVVPIVNDCDEPVGILLESSIKEFLYTPYGISLLLNPKNSNTKLKSLIQKHLEVDINSNLENLIELFASNSNLPGIVITKNSKYYGFLYSNSIIEIMNEENIIQARDQNPLTKLPGNHIIEKYIENLPNKTKHQLICYLDLDNFKAFNDVYGFRKGDRIIQLFADTLRKELPSSFFKAHIGGDDFFIALELDNLDTEKEYKMIKKMLDKFSQNALSFYDAKDRKNKYLQSTDRFGVLRKFPLLSASASVIVIPGDKLSVATNILDQIFSLQKKISKTTINHIAMSVIL